MRVCEELTPTPPRAPFISSRASLMEQGLALFGYPSLDKQLGVGFRHRCTKAVIRTRHIVMLAYHSHTELAGGCLRHSFGTTPKCHTRIDITLSINWMAKLPNSGNRGDVCVHQASFHPEKPSYPIESLRQSRYPWGAHPSQMYPDNQDRALLSA